MQPLQQNDQNLYPYQTPFAYQQPPIYGPYSTNPPIQQHPMYIPEQHYIQHQAMLLPNFTPIFKVQSDATHSLYIDGIPNDTSEREVSHVFRPFPGYQRVRLIRKSTQKGREYFLCFVDFDDSIQASIAMTTLQGYRFDKSDKMGLKISFATNPKDNLKEKKR